MVSVCVCTVKKRKHVNHITHIGRTQESVTLIQSAVHTHTHSHPLQGYHKLLSHNFSLLSVEQALKTQLIYQVSNEKTANPINIPCGISLIASRCVP